MKSCFNLPVGDVDLDAGLIRYIARAKRKRIPTVAILAREVRDAILSLMKNRPADAWLFTCRGRKVQQSSFRKQFMKASKAAGLGEALGLSGERELGGVSWIRHAVVTALRPRLGVDAVQKYANHSSVKVAEQFYDLDTDALALKFQAVEETRKNLRTRTSDRIPPDTGHPRRASADDLTFAIPWSRPILAGLPRNAQSTTKARQRLTDQESECWNGAKGAREILANNLGL